MLYRFADERIIDPKLGRRILRSAIDNGDSVPDLILFAAEFAVNERRPFTLGEVRILASVSGTFDKYGNLTE